MRVSTRLLVSLLPTVAVTMSVYAGWATIEREDVMMAEARRETQAYATALALAFEYALRDERHENIQEIINKVSREPSAYGILVYDATGRRVFASDPLATPGSAGVADLRRVLRTGATVRLEREIDDQKVLSVLRPIRDERGRVTGALEAAQPLSRIQAEQARVRRRYLLNTLTLLAAVALVTLWLVRRTVGKPMRGLVQAVRALGRGELTHRMDEAPGSGELADLAREFNRMATSLEATRADVIREAEERVALERRLRESEKMAAIGTLAAGLAHEIAAPLNVISGRAEQLLRTGVVPEVRERYLRIIVQQIGRITRTVSNLLRFARRREARLQAVEVGAVLDGVAEFLDGELARAGTSLERHEARPLWAHADPELLNQVLVNLFLNAIQALEESDGDRRIVVRSGPVVLGGSSEWVTLELADTGPGIPESLRAKVFDPFFTTKPSGTGLGLALARSMMEEQGGDLDIAPAPEGRGALFRLTLPAAAAAEARGA